MNLKEQKNYEQIFKEKVGIDFNTFYLKYHPKLIWMIRKMNITELDAEDIATEAILHSLEKIELYDNNYEYSTWLFHIGKNKAYKYLSDRKLIIFHDDLVSDSNFSDELVSFTREMIYEHNFYDITIDTNNLKKIDILKCKTKSEAIYKSVLKEISSLDEKFRKILELFVIQNLTYTQISSKLNIDQQTVKNRLHHGKIHLKRKLRETLKYIDENY